MFHVDSAALRVARFVLAYTDEATMTYERGDSEAASALDLSVRTYRDSLRKLERLGGIWQQPVKRGPEKPGENRHRVCGVNLTHPFWTYAIAADALADWRR